MVDIYILGMLSYWPMSGYDIEVKLKEMNIEAELDIEQHDDVLNINMNGEDMAILIGKRGQTLDSLQYLVSLVVNKNKDEYLRVVLDTENYRAKRKETLESLAEKLAAKVKKSRKNVILEPMNPAPPVTRKTLSFSNFNSLYPIFYSSFYDLESTESS